MHQHIEERCVRIGQYIADTGATVREAARHFGVSKSSVHKDMDERLALISATLWAQVKDVMRYNKSVRHLRGGEATRKKYEGTAKASENRREFPAARPPPPRPRPSAHPGPSFLFIPKEGFSMWAANVLISGV